jgi:hypothetical protein
MELCNDDYIITSLLRKSCYFHWLCDDSVVVLAGTFVHLLIKAGVSIFYPNKPLALPGQPYRPRRPKFFYWSTSATGHLPLSLLVYLCTGRSLGRGLSTSSKKLCPHASRVAATFWPRSLGCYVLAAFTWRSLSTGLDGRNWCVQRQREGWVLGIFILSTW